MHYCLHLFTKQFPTNEVIKEELAPYNSELLSDDQPLPAFTYDWWQVGGRYGGQIKLGILGTEDKYRWDYLTLDMDRRAGRLFRSQFLEKLASRIPGPYLTEDEALGYMGFGDGFIYADGAWLPDVTNLADIAGKCFYILADGEVMAREVWDGEHWISTDYDFDEKAYALMLRMAKNHYLTVIDLHD